VNLYIDRTVLVEMSVLEGPTAEAVKKLLKKRSSHKGHVTRNLNSLKIGLLAEYPDIRYLNDCLDAVKTQKKVIEDVFISISDIYIESNIEKELDDLNLDQETYLTELDTGLSTYHSLIVKHKMTTDEAERVKEAERLKSLPIKPSDRSETKSVSVLKPVLPKLSISKFDGNPLKWTSFWDIFKSTIHDSTNFAKIQKFCYLRSYLISEAAETIEG